MCIIGALIEQDHTVRGCFIKTAYSLNGLFTCHRLQGHETELLFFIMFYDELHKAIAQITHPVKKQNRGCICGCQSVILKKEFSFVQSLQHGAAWQR